MFSRCLCCIGLLVCASGARGDGGGPSVALFRLEPLGVAPQIVQRLDGLLRLELSRLSDAAPVSLARVHASIRSRPELSQCTGAAACLTAVGRALGVQRIVAGNVGALGSDYVLNVKLLEVDSGRELRRLQMALRGASAQLIEAVRVAAYRLVAPQKLRGALHVLANIAGARVTLDGRYLGKTPVPIVDGLPVGEHQLRVSKAQYLDVEQSVAIRLQKTKRIVVRLQTPPASRARVKPRLPWYTRWWFWSAVGVVAAGVGVGLGLASRSSGAVNCTARPAQCGL